MATFEELYAINVNEKTEKKNGLTYLSWAWAWAEFRKACPDARYEIWKDEQGRPYIYDESLGYMVSTKVTVGEESHEMWLPVMNNVNKAMKAEAYTYTDRYGKEKSVEPATMFDINTAIMRCLTKNLAMFGLGLYIYAGEDLPESEVETTSTKASQKLSKGSTKEKATTQGNLLSITKEQAQSLLELAKEYTSKTDRVQNVERWLCQQAKVQFLVDITQDVYETWVDYMSKEIEAGRYAT